MAKRRNKSEEKKIAKERIEDLFNQTEKTKDNSLQKRYVTLARKISEKYKVRIPRELRRKYCRNCNSYFIPSKNVRVRLNNQKVIYYCFNCKHHTRLPYLKEIKEKRKVHEAQKVQENKK